MIPAQLHQWAIRHRVSMAVIQDLLTLMGAADEHHRPAPELHQAGSEAAVQAELRLNASKMGGRLWRNNRGAGYMQDGSFIRWGLANDSKQMNDKIKSHDLIGIKPVLITPQHVGTIIGQFWSMEAKPADWRYTGTPHEQAQMDWAQLIISLGGDARFANRRDQL